MISFIQYNEHVSKVIVGFSKGKKPASQGLAPGECAWKNRLVLADEPTNLCQEVSHVEISTTYVRHGAFNPPDLWLLQTAWSRDAPWLEEIRSEDKVLAFRVKDDRKNHCFVVIP